MRARSTPDVLEVYVGSFDSPAFGLWWDGARLVYESFVSGYEERKQVRLEPSGAQWARFWKTMDAIDVWSWAERYDKARAATDRPEDGTRWSVSLQHGERRVESAGDSAGPGAGATSVDDSMRFDAFAEAVSRLTGGYRFA